MPKRIPAMTESFVTIVDSDRYTTDAEDVMTTPAPTPVRLGRFVILGVLGEGGSGVVYEARSARKGVKVALKVLRAELLPSRREVDRFRAEAEHLGAVAHPGIIELDEVGILPDGRPFLVMPLLEGETLAARLERGPLSLGDAMEYFTVLADAVAALHDAGLVHRDLKPENVFLEETSSGTRPVLLDLGIARSMAEERSTTLGRIRGTPIYMAPERLLGTKADVASDLYELAVVFAMMLSGQLPWRSTRNLLERLSPVPDDMASKLPPALVAILREALSASPEERPPRVHDFAMLVESARGRKEEDLQASHPPSAAGAKRGHGRRDPRRGGQARGRARDAQRDGEGHRASCGRESGVALSVLPRSGGDRRRVGSAGARASAGDPRGRRCARAR